MLRHIVFTLTGLLLEHRLLRSAGRPMAGRRLRARRTTRPRSRRSPDRRGRREQKLGVAFKIVPVADGLENPWGLAFLPDGKMLVTERPGRLRVVAADGTQVGAGRRPAGRRRAQPGRPARRHARSGLRHQSASSTGAIPSRATAARTTPPSRAASSSTDATPRVDDVQVIFHQTPSLRSTLHFGSRLVWGRDGTLFITHGRSLDHRRAACRRSAWTACSARSPASTPTARSRRTTRSSARPACRPRCGRSAIATSRRPRCIPTTGELWEVEHGTRGGDEINIARKGKDYGWPTIAYGIEYRGGQITGGIQQQAGMEQPLYYWDPIIGPSGMAFYTANLFPAWKGSLFVGGHGTRDLVRLSLEGEKVTGEERLLVDQKDAVRDVRQGPDGALYIVTDGAQGRIYKLVP